MSSILWSSLDVMAWFVEIWSIIGSVGMDWGIGGADGSGAFGAEG
jgi:hypothetical protein